MQVMGNKPLLSPKEIMDYFEPPPASARTLIVIGSLSLLILGAPCLLSSLSSNPQAFTGALIWTGCTAIPLILGIASLARYNAKPRPTDEEYEEWVRSWQPSIQHYGMQKIGLDPSEIAGEILVVRGQIWPNDNYETAYYRSHGCPIVVKRGKDGRPHASINKFTVFYPTQHYIGVFNGDVNALSPLRFEGTRTYFYDDVVGVDASSFGEQLDGFTYNLQRFELRISSGQAIGSTTTRVTDGSVDNIVRSLRTLLRDKKYGTRGGGQGLAGS
jgi:hypothetical protein